MPDLDSGPVPARPGAHALGPGDDVIVSSLAGQEAEVTIDIDPTNTKKRVAVGYSPSRIPMNTFRTSNGGHTWTLVALGQADDGIPAFLRGDPTVAYDANGDVYVGYGAWRSAPDEMTVVVARSADGGQTYPQLTFVATTPNAGAGIPGNDKWHLATGRDPSVASQQNVYVAWTQNVLEPGIDQRIVCSASTDGGATFSAPVILNDASIAGTSPGNIFVDPAVGPGGEVYVAWWNVNTTEVLIDVSLDGGATFGTDVVVTTSSTGFKTSIPAQPDRGVFVGPVLDVDRSGGPNDGRLYITYTDLGAGGLPNVDVFVQHSDDSGATWSARTLVNDDGGTTSQFLPWIDVDQVTGAVHAIWYDARNDVNNKKVEVVRATSTDGGVTFGTNLVVSDNPSDQSVDNPNRYAGNYLEYIGLAVHDGDMAAVWSDNSLNPADLDYLTEASGALKVPALGIGAWIVMVLGLVAAARRRRNAKGGATS